MDRIVDIGTQKYTKIYCHDEPGAGGACHKYTVQNVPQDPKIEYVPELYAKIDFQNGPIKESGVNGCHNEDLIAIVIDRLQHFQAEAFSCRENALAITKLEEALHWLKHRTEGREKRGIEGTNII